jgi:hypothetical protein
LKFDPLKLDVACGGENKGIFIKAPPGFEPGDGGFADLFSKCKSNHGQSFDQS